MLLSVDDIGRLENHSTTKSCTIFWNIIKPVEGASNGNYSAPEEEYVSSEQVHAAARQQRSSAVAV